MAASKAIGFLNFKFGADLSGFERGMKKAQKSLKKFGKSVERTGKNLTMGLTLPLVGLGIASLKAFDAQQKAIAQVEAGLKSTGNQVGITSEELQKMAADLQKTSLFGDEDILGDVTAQLLTFTGIAKSQFGETQLAVVNLSTKLKTDLKSTAIMVGKALNDPITQLSALSRNGVRFTDEQKALINSLWEMGDAAGAQSIILKELEIQFGGSAEAARKAGMGPLQALQMQLSDLSEQIGARLLPHVQKFVKWIVSLAEKFDGLSESQKDNIVKWGLILAAIGPILIVIGKISLGIASLIFGFKGLAKWLITHPYIALGVAITAVAFALGKWISKAFGVSDAQRSINEVMDEANKAILTQQTEVGILTEVLKSENSSLTDKETALNKLKEISPEYYGTLNASKIDLVALDTATKNYTVSIQKQAIAEAGRAKLVELSSQLIDAKTRAANMQKFTDTLSKFGTEEVNLGIFNIIGEKGSEARVNALMEEIQAITDLVVANEQSIKSNEKLEDSNEDVTETIEEESEEVKALNSQIAALEQQLKNAQKVTDEITTSTTKYKSSLVPLIDKIKEYADIQKRQSGVFDIASYKKHLEDISKMWQDGGLLAGPENMLNWTEKLTKAQEAHNATMELMEDIMFSAAMSAADSQQKFFNAFLENIKKAIKQLLIQLAVLTVISLLLGGPTMTIGKAFGIAKGKVLGLEGFAEGGLVTGPTTALIGEGIGTTASNPEVVAPLDKLKSMIGGKEQNITVTGKLVGNDIFLSNAKTGFNRLRTV